MKPDIVSPERGIFTNLEQAVQWRQDLKEKGLRLTVTNGCFDILHRGHAEYLLSARRTADALLVLVNSDASVRSLKGPGRPVNCEYDRAYLLASMRCVDAVLVFDSPRCTAELYALQPHAYAKAGDYTFETLNEQDRAVLIKHNIKVHFIPFVPDHSTTLILQKAACTGKNPDRPK